ncbi:hypothetical protein PILCRDRAFT_815385 [Piloderma croceum F 1598]|uniref:Uncharacterized protein n=1 Tax=Piloderma croceum (strain F 1598) TaxID=765440 RepID=A0A0C3G8F2_PILCF|nr:hypothetical protein PILCRDRAFT_815385 [Piloderma croceum F 1598]
MGLCASRHRLAIFGPLFHFVVHFPSRFLYRGTVLKSDMIFLRFSRLVWYDLAHRVIHHFCDFDNLNCAVLRQSETFRILAYSSLQCFDDRSNGYWCW